MGELPRVLAIFWAALVFASLTQLFWAGGAGDPVTQLWGRIETFVGWQGAALVVAIIAAGLSRQRRDRPLGPTWWLGWGPLYGSLGMALIVLAALTAGQLMSTPS